MVTTTNVSIHQVATYYDKDDYYSRTITNEDFWFGSALNNDIGNNITNPHSEITVPIQSKEYLSKVIQLTNDITTDTKKLAIDITFSPPKSVSIAMLDPTLKYDILDAHNEAVENVLTYIERNNIIWRKKRNNFVTNINTKNALFACIQHRLSREQDPQLHTHCLLFRKTLNEKGEIRTIEDRFIHSNQYLFKLMYDNELLNALNKRGFSLRESNNLVQKDKNFEILEVNDILINHFSKRQKQIEIYKKENGLSDSWKESHFAGLASRKAKKEANLQELEMQ